MERLPLIGGSYSARSIIASAEKCINYYPEINPKDALCPTTHYQRPGLVPLVQAPNKEPVRQVYSASNEAGYCVIGQRVYFINSSFQLNQIGTLTTPRLNPVSFADNGTTILLVDGSQFGYTIDMASNAFAQVNDLTGIFNGGNKVDVIDGFLLWAPVLPQPTQSFGSTHFGEPVTFDPLYTASKFNYPDLIQTLMVNRHEILLFGTKKSEIWYDAGNPLFPFAELPGAYIEHGIDAIYSVASADISVFWLAKDLQGHRMVLRQRGYQTTRISNHAVEFALRKMSNTSDAIGYTYQQDGHVFYVMQFPSGNQTWVYDDAVIDPMTAWHQEAWTDRGGVLNRHRGNCYAFLYGKNVVGDFANGTLYSMDLDTYTDTVDGRVGPVTYIRTMPHIGMGINPAGQLLRADGRLMDFGGFWADLECGNGPLDADGTPAKVILRTSVDRGKTFGTDVLQSAGAPGQYQTQPQWRRLGVGRDVIFELQHSIAGAAALNGAWVDGKILEA